MADVDVFVWYDSNGNITAVGHVIAGQAEKVEPLAGENQKVLKLRMGVEGLGTLRETHTVDPHKGVLCPRRHDL
jgi:hypothetical protein